MGVVLIPLILLSIAAVAISTFLLAIAILMWQRGMSEKEACREDVLEENRGRMDE